MKPVLIALAAALALGACATATPYAPAGAESRYGYSDVRLEQNRYRVTYSGNSVTSREQVEMSLLFRAAELTSQNGYDWFATVGRATDRDTRFVGVRDPWGPAYGRYSPFWGPSWRYYRRGFWSPWNDPWGPDFDTRQVDRFEASTEVVMGRGAKPADDPNAFDAREVMANLAPRVVAPVSGR